MISQEELLRIITTQTLNLQIEMQCGPSILYHGECKQKFLGVHVSTCEDKLMSQVGHEGTIMALLSPVPSALFRN